MRTNSTKLGFLAAAAVAACAALPAAQAQNARPCTAIDNDAERLACYDRALRPAPAPPPAPAATAAAPTPAAASAAPSAAAPSTIATENRATRRDREVRQSTASAAPAAPVAPAAPTARRAPQAPAKAQAPDIVPIVIVQVRALPGRPATFVTDQGETWVQTDGERKWPDVPFKAAIKPGSMGSSFLVPDDFAHQFRVHRGQ